MHTFEDGAESVVPVRQAQAGVELQATRRLACTAARAAAAGATTAQEQQQQEHLQREQSGSISSQSFRCKMYELACGASERGACALHSIGMRAAAVTTNVATKALATKVVHLVSASLRPR